MSRRLERSRRRQRAAPLSGAAQPGSRRCSPRWPTLRRPRAAWLYEPKLDGVRVLVYANGGNVRLFSRNRKPLDDAYPELVDALSFAVRGDAVLDGEVVAVDPDDRPVSSFSRLQQRMQLRDARPGPARATWR